MGFNLGAALGAAAESGVNTYTKMQRQAMEDLAAKKLLREINQAEETDTVMKEAAAQGGAAKNGVAAPDMFDKAINYGEGHEAIRNHVATLTPEQQNEVYRKLKGTEVDVSKEAGIDLSKARVYAGENGPMAATEFEKRSFADTASAAAEKLAALGNYAGFKTASDIYKGARELDYTKGWDRITKQANDWRQTFDSALQKGGVSGALETMDPVLKKLGINARASGDKVEILGADGKVATTFNGVAELEKGFHSAVSSYVANAALSLTGGDPSKVAGMIKDTRQGEYYENRTERDKKMLPLEMQAKQAAINASNASAGASNRSGNEQYRAGDQIVTINKGKGTAIVDGKEMPITALPADIVNNLRPLQRTDVAPQYKDKNTGEAITWREGKFYDMNNAQVAAGPHIVKDNAGQNVAQTHVDASSGKPLWTRQGEAGFFTEDNKRYDGELGNVLPNRDAKPNSIHAMDAKWRDASASYMKDNPEMTDAQMARLRDQFYGNNNFAPPSVAAMMVNGTYPKGFTVEDAKGKKINVGGKPIPQAMRDQFFQKYPYAKPRTQ
jgi:hypothetical protein